MGARRAAPILMKISHFDRIPLYTRSLVYKGMLYKGFFGPVLDFQKKLGFPVLDLRELRVLENMLVLRPKPTHCIFLYI